MFILYWWNRPEIFKFKGFALDTYSRCGWVYVTYNCIGSQLTIANPISQSLCKNISKHLEQYSTYHAQIQAECFIELKQKEEKNTAACQIATYWKNIVQWSPFMESGWIWASAKGSSWRCDPLSLLHPLLHKQAGVQDMCHGLPEWWRTWKGKSS